MWKDNLVFYKSTSYLNFCTSIGVHKKPFPRLLTVRTSSTHQWVRVIPGHIILGKHVIIYVYSIDIFHSYL